MPQPPPLRFGPAASTAGCKNPQPLARKPAAAGAEKKPRQAPKKQRKKRKQESVVKFSLRCELQDPQQRRQWEARARYVENGKLQTWLQLGPEGIGCRVCARHFAKAGHSSRAARPSKWCNFAIGGLSNAFIARQNIAKHAASRSHRLACGVTRAKDGRRRPPPRQPCESGSAPAAPQPLARELSAAESEDAKLLKGNVPQAGDWRRAWASFSERVSLRKEARVSAKEVALHSKDTMAAKRRKRRRRMLTIMAEVGRVKVREVLRRASHITLAMDDSKNRKIIRFRADVPTPAATGAAWCRGKNQAASGFSYTGVLGILHLAKSETADFEDDHAACAVKQLSAFLTRFCTPLGKDASCDQELRAAIVGRVACLSADGASKERRALTLAARELFPNLKILIRDPAHAIRIAYKNPLHCDELFGQVWEDLFDGRHALAPDLMNSDKWSSLLVAIQKENMILAAVPSVQPLVRPFDSVMQSLAFAKQRFDSTAGPVGKIALMLLPVATLLAYIASDERHDKSQRVRARNLLQKLNTRFCIALGVSADWGIVCQWYLRLFDNANHDIAKSRAEIDAFCETLEAVFVQGRIFQRLKNQSAAAATGAAETAESLPSAPAPGQEMCFITARVIRNLRHRYVFYADGQPVVPWREPTADDVAEVQHRMQNVARMTIDRLRADFPRDDVRSALAMFGRRLIQKAFGPAPHADTRKLLLHGVARLARIVGVEEHLAVLQYHGVLAFMLGQFADQLQPLAKKKTNPQAWAMLLDDDFALSEVGRMPKQLSALRVVIRFYISLEDGECTVERDLAEYRAQQLEHRTHSEQFHDDLLIVRLNCPQTIEDFKGGCDGRGLTGFSRECARHYSRIFGHRFGHYNPAATVAAKRKRDAATGRFRKIAGGVLGAARIAVLNSRRVQPRVELHPGIGTEDSAYWNKDMKRFQERNRKNVAGVLELRASPGAPFVQPRGIDLTHNPAAKPQALPRNHERVALVGVSDCVVSGVSIAHGPHRCAEADLVVLNDHAVLHADSQTLAKSEDLTLALLYITLRGLDVVTKAQVMAATGAVCRIQQCMRHARLCSGQEQLRHGGKIVFLVRSNLADSHPNVHKALRKVSAEPGASVEWCKTDREVSRDTETSLSTLEDVVLWAQAARRIDRTQGAKAMSIQGVLHDK